MFSKTRYAAARLRMTGFCWCSTAKDRHRHFYRGQNVEHRIQHCYRRARTRYAAARLRLTGFCWCSTAKDRHRHFYRGQNVEHRIQHCYRRAKTRHADMRRRSRVLLSKLCSTAGGNFKCRVCIQQFYWEAAITWSQNPGCGRTSEHQATADVPLLPNLT